MFEAKLAHATLLYSSEMPLIGFITYHFSSVFNIDSPQHTFNEYIKEAT